LPNINPRLSVVLPRSTFATVARLAALQGRSRAAVVRDFLTEAEPVLSRVAGMLELAAKAQGEWPRDFVAELERAQGELEGKALEAMGQLDAFADRMDRAAGSGRQSRPARSRAKARRGKRGTPLD